MQATQSNKASDFLRSDSTDPHRAGFGNGDSNHARLGDTASPISAPSFLSPIQAARRYLERQRGGGQHIESPKSDCGGEASGAPSEPLNRNPYIREQSSREQDRRLERSLYEGHSIEAGLNFDDPYGTVENEVASDHAYEQGYDRAYFADSDGSEPLFPYAAPRPDAMSRSEPDPEAVRGAILRLARESGRAWEPVGGSLEPAKLAAQSPSAPTYEASDATTVLTGSSATTATAAFAEVALRVWDMGWDTGWDGGEGRASAGAFGAPAPPQHGQPAGAFSPIVAPDKASNRASEALAASPAPVASESLLPRNLCSQPQTTETQGAYPESAFRDAALAHDACNLLSALRLYSDLLRSPGVLHGEHLRYAEELKLIAGRSQSLIDRLLGPRGAIGAVSAVESLAIPAVDSLHLINPATAPHPARSTAEPGDEIALGSTRLTIPQQKGIHLAETLDVQAPIQRTPPSEGTSGAKTVEDAVAASPTEATAWESQTTSLVDLLMRWGSLLSTLAHGTLDISIGPDAGSPVPVAAEALERILVNLVKNARAATVESGAIRIGVAARVDGEVAATKLDVGHESGSGTGRAIVLTVDDSGCGMSDAQINRILGAGPVPQPAVGLLPESVSLDRSLDRAAEENLEQGYGRWAGSEADRSEGPASAVVGTATGVGWRDPLKGSRQGLGLKVVKELVEASGGRLAIESRIGRGTRIEICWPVADVAAVAERPGMEQRLNRADHAAVVPAGVLVSASDASRPHPDATAQVSLSSPQAVVGPDGFCEAELRAMILRLHRTNSHDTGQDGRSRSGRGAAANVLDRRGPVPSLYGRDPGQSASEANLIQTVRPEADNYSAVKGAIAC